VTPHAAYRHFEDKEALLTAVSERAFGMLADRLERELVELPASSLLALRDEALNPLLQIFWTIKTLGMR
jgi:AcrR family transcriptional regulator